jgi:hypothetical protein
MGPIAAPLNHRRFRRGYRDIDFQPVNKICRFNLTFESRSMFRTFRNANDNRTVVFQFNNDETMGLTKTPIEKTSNGMKFIEYQLFLPLIFTGTVHGSQEMTLQRAVIDRCMKF